MPIQQVTRRRPGNGAVMALTPSPLSHSPPLALRRWERGSFVRATLPPLRQPNRAVPGVHPNFVGGSRVTGR